MIPPFPTEKLNAAIAGEDWDGAVAIMDAHYDAIREAIKDPDAAKYVDAWNKQLADIEIARSGVSQLHAHVQGLLDALMNSRRGVQAYRVQMVAA